MRAWQTLSDGLVAVDFGDGLGLRPSILEGRPGEQEAVERVLQWRELAERSAAKHDVPLPWVLGVIYSESRGFPAVRSEKNAVGLMQILTSVHPITDAQALDPAQNIDMGTSLLGDSIRLGYELPEAASRYNAGAGAGGVPHPSSDSPWGIREQKGYIDGVVRAHNEFHGLVQGAPPGVVASLFPVVVLGGLAIGAAWWTK
jgi:hypothetical protein